jgi:methyltransferase family protein
MVTRHEFLEHLHEVLEPRAYLEIGVQHGDSLRLAKCRAYGIDPYPIPYGHFDGNQFTLVRQTSDEFFTRGAEQVVNEPIDLVFIDGMHLYEYALRDFINTERFLANERTVVVFDDMLPRNHAEAAREQPPGDWTGDVWRVFYILKDRRPDLHIQLVDTEPTGVMVVSDLEPGSTQLAEEYFNITNDLALQNNEQVPDAILARTEARSPEDVLITLTFEKSTWE